MELIPAVDVLEGRVVRLYQGMYDRSTVYADDPVSVAAGWISRGASMVHVVDLGGARRGVPDLDLWKSLGAAGIRFQAGGGIRDSDSARAVLELGADRVMMGTSAVEDPSRLSGLGEIVVAAIDVRHGRATTDGWESAGRPLAAVLDDLGRVGVGRLLVTGIGVDGTLEGPDLDLTKRVVERQEFRVIGSGGVGTLADITRLASIGCEAAVVGRALYEGRFTLEAALAHLATGDSSSG